MNSETWRIMDTEARRAYIFWLYDNAQEKWAAGIKKYQSDKEGFQGDPLDHAIEEAFDLLCYLWFTKRQQNAG